MFIKPNVERLSKLDVANFKTGDTIVFCEQCDWQLNFVGALANTCPDCGYKTLSVTKVDEELINLCKGAKQ